MYKLSEIFTRKWILKKWHQDRFAWCPIAEFSSIEEANIYCDLNSIPKNAIAKETFEDFIHFYI